jgi:hypothetical protein
LSANINAGLELLLQLINSSAPVSAAIRLAHSENRPLTREELQAAFDQDNDARNALVASIERAQLEGRS